MKIVMQILISTGIFLLGASLFILFSLEASAQFYTFQPQQGGTGTSTKPTYGQILQGNSSGTYDLVATSSLGIGSTVWDDQGTYLQPANSEGVVINASSTIQGDFTVDTDTLFVDSGNDRVGVGTVNPQALLNIDVGSIGSTDTVGLLLESSSAATGAETRILFSNSGTTNQMAYIGGAFQDTADDGYLAFGTAPSSDTPVERVRIDKDGYLGIGSTTPSEKLAVHGNALIAGSTTVRALIATSTLLVGNAGDSFIVTQDGSVGIKDSGPDYALDVGGDIRLDGNADTATLRFTKADGARLLYYATGDYHFLTNPGGDLRIGPSWDGNKSIQIKANDSDGYAQFDVGSLLGSLRFEFGGSEKARISSTGYLGLGDTSPDLRLHVGSSTPGSIAANNYYNSAYVSGDLEIDGTLYTDGGVNFGSTYTDIVASFDSSGNLVGTSTPSVASINATSTSATSTFAGGLTVEGTFIVDTDTGARPAYFTRLGTITQALSIGVQDNDVIFESIQDETSGTQGGFEFRLDDDGTLTPSFRVDDGTSELLRIQDSGNVGIGTSSPQARLHVADGFSGGLPNSSSNLVIEDSGDVVLQLLSPNTQNNFIFFGDEDDNNPGRIDYDHADNSLGFFTSDTERISIDLSGNVGIGSTTPSQTLSVHGNALVSGNLTSADFFSTGTIHSYGTGTSTFADAIQVGRYEERISVIEGDSFSNNCVSDWGGYLATSSPYFDRSQVECVGGNGETVGQMVNQYATEVQPHFLPLNSLGSSREKFFFLWAGYNDLNFGSTSDEIYTDLKTLWANARADGAKVVAFTHFDENTLSAAEVIEKNELNKDILSDPDLYDYLIRTDLLFYDWDSQLGWFRNNNHLNNEGNKVLAEAIQQQLEFRPWFASPRNGIASTTQFDIQLNPGGKTVIGTSTPIIDTSLWLFGNAGNTDILQITNSASSSVLTVNDQGQVGIGTTTPGKKFSVGGTALIGNRLFVEGETRHYGDVIFESLDSASGNNLLCFTSSNELSIVCDGLTPPMQVAGGVITLVTSTDLMGFGTTTSAKVGISYNSGLPALLINQSGVGDLLHLEDNKVTKFVVKDGGNVGIGTTTPEKTLGVSGDSLFNGDITVTNSTTTLNSVTFPFNSYMFLSDGGNANTFKVATSTSGDNLIWFQTAQQGGRIGFGTTPVNSARGKVTISDTRSEPNKYVLSLQGAGGGGMRFEAGGHVLYRGADPTLTSCGSAPSFLSNSTDSLGQINMDSDTGTFCQLDFAYSWSAKPICQVWSETDNIGTQLNASTTQSSLFIATATTTDMNDQVINYRCDQVVS